MKITKTRSAPALVAVLLLGAACAKVADQVSFKTPEDAVNGFAAAMEKEDNRAALRELLGPGVEDLLSSGDAVQDKVERQAVLDGFKLKHSLRDEGNDAMTLVMGNDDWPLPIPIVKRDGRWFFDGAAGADELIYRRVGRNELGAIDVCGGLVSAQIEYASESRDGDPAGIYALKFISDEGMQNGLYWPAAEGEPPSPLGPGAADAAAEGYRAGTNGERKPYHGYFYRMLYAQGQSAKGGTRDYFADGVMTEGFALIAWPADYGSSGVQTFIVNQDGVVFQKDLGEDTADAVQTINTFDPDSTWTAVEPPQTSS
ncbi:MAG: DUF2950 domain-containing protein [Burkholderiales bacterium]